MCGMSRGADPWKVVSGTNASSLKFPAGGSAVAPSFCVDPTQPKIRFFCTSPPLWLPNVADAGTTATITITFTEKNTPATRQIDDVEMDPWRSL